MSKPQPQQPQQQQQQQQSHVEMSKPQPQQQQQQQQPCTTELNSPQATSGRNVTNSGAVDIRDCQIDAIVNNEHHHYTAIEHKPDTSFEDALDKTKADDYHVYTDINGDDVMVTDEMVERLDIANLLNKCDVTDDVLEDDEGKSPKPRLSGLKRGKRLALVGRPGSGKSVHASAITRHYATKGHVTLRINAEAIIGTEKEIGLGTFLLGNARIGAAFTDDPPKHYNKLKDLGANLVIVVDGIHRSKIELTSRDLLTCIPGGKYPPCKWLHVIFKGELLVDAIVVVTMIPSVFTSTFHSYKFTKLPLPCTRERRSSSLSSFGSSLSSYGSEVSSKVIEFMDGPTSPVKCVSFNSYFAIFLAKRVHEEPRFLEKKTEYQILVSVMAGRLRKISPELKRICYEKLDSNDEWRESSTELIKQIEQFHIGEFCTEQRCVEVKPFHQTIKICIAALHVLDQIVEGKLNGEYERKLSAPRLLRFVCAWISSGCEEITEPMKGKFLKIFFDKLKDATSQKKFVDHVTCGDRVETREMKSMLLALYELHHDHHELHHKLRQMAPSSGELPFLHVELDGKVEEEVVTNYLKFLNPQLQRLSLHLTSSSVGMTSPSVDMTSPSVDMTSTSVDMTSTSRNELASIITHQLVQQKSGRQKIPIVDIYNIESFEQIRPNIKSLLNITRCRLHLNFAATNFTTAQFRQIRVRCGDEFYQQPQQKILLQLSHNHTHHVLLPRDSSSPSSVQSSPFNLVVNRHKRSQTTEDATLSGCPKNNVIAEKMTLLPSPTNKDDVTAKGRRQSRDDINLSYAYARPRSAGDTRSRGKPPGSTWAARRTPSRPPVSDPHFTRSQSTRTNPRHHDVIINKPHQVDMLELGGRPNARICEVFFNENFTDFRIIEKLSTTFNQIHLLTLYNVREPLELIAAINSMKMKRSNFLRHLHAWLVIRCVGIPHDQSQQACDQLRDVICEQIPSKKLRIDIHFDGRMENIKPGN